MAEREEESDAVTSLSTEEVKFQPIVFHLHIKKAKNVPVGDIQSSDPFCVILMGGKRVGKTSIRKWTVNPMWNETFTIPLLHLKFPLVIEIWDFDAVSSNDLLGKVELDLDEIPPNIEMDQELKVMRANPKIKPRGVLYIGVKLERKYSLIDVTSVGGKDRVEMNQSDLPDCTIGKIRDMLKVENTPIILQRAFLQSTVLNSQLLHWSFYRDIMHDINRIFSIKATKDITTNDQFLHMKMKRSLKVNSFPFSSKSLSINMKSNKTSPSCFDIPDCGVIIETSSSDFFIVHAQNRFLYREFVKSLRRLYFLGSSQITHSSIQRRSHYISEDKCDDWQNTIHFSAILNVTVRNESHPFLCCLQPTSMRLAMFHPDTNIETFHVDLHTVETIHIGLEYEEYKPYDLQVNIVSAKLPRDLKNRADLRGDEDQSKRSSGKWYPGKRVVRAIKGTGSFVRNSVVDASSSVITALNSPGSISTKVAVNFPNAHCFETKLMDGSGPYWDDYGYHRIDLTNIANAKGDNGNEYEQNVPIGIHMHLLMEDSNSLLTVLGSKFVRYSDLVPVNVLDEVCESSTSSEGGLASQEYSQSFDFDSDISLDISIVRGENLLPPEKGVLSVENLLTSTTDSLLTGVDVMTNAVILSHGQEVEKNERIPYGKDLLTNRKPCVVVSFAASDRTISDEYPAYRTKGVKDTCDPVWKHDVVLLANDGLYSAQTVLLQVRDRLRKHTTEGKMGVAVIPIASFFTEKLVSGGSMFLRLPVLPEADMTASNKPFVEGDLGHIFVEIKLSIKKSECVEEFPPSVDIKTQLYSSNEYNTTFPCEVIAHSSMKQTNLSDIERFHVAPGLEGLSFLGDSYQSSASDVDTKEKAAQALLHQFQRFYSVNDSHFVEYHVFENQRRVFLEWSSSNLMSFERTAYTEESGTTSCPFTNYDVKFNPPQGFKWQDESKEQWIVDRDYTNTDEEGWTYGTDFGFVMQNLRAGESTTTSHLRSVRRRRWKRIAIKVLNTDIDVNNTDTNCHIDVSNCNDDFSPNQVNVSKPEIKETFHVFYNQRRSVLSLSFGPNNLFPTDRHAFTDNSGQRSYPECRDVEDMVPPTGYKWARGSKWKTDLAYTDTDEFGWTYAVDFHFLESNLKKGRSTKTSTLQSVRRRKYCRDIVPSEIGDITSLVERDDAVGENESTAPKEAPKTKLQAFELNSEQVLGLCKEREDLSSPIFVPWNQVLRADVVSPSVLCLGIVVHRFFGEDCHGLEIYREVEMEVFIVDCPAKSICGIVGDRLHLFQLRRDLKTLLSSGNMNGDDYDESYCEESGLIKSDHGNSVTARELSLGSRTIEKLYFSSIQIELALEHISDNISSLTEIFHEDLISSEILYLKRELGRVKLYISVLLAASLFGPSYEEHDIKRLIHSDKEEALTFFESASDDQSAKQTVSFLLDMAELRVRDYALCGWSHQGDLLESCLKLIINSYYINIVETLGFFFDSKDALEALQGNESKLRLIEFIIENDNHLNMLVQNALLPYNLTISPPPLLSLSLNIKSLMQWYSELLSEEMQGFVQRTFEVTLNSSSPNSPDEYNLPWDIHNDNGIFISSIPLDTGNILKGYLGLTKNRFNKQFVSVDVKAGMSIIDEKIHIFYLKSLSCLSKLYFNFVKSHDWTTPLPLNDEGKYEEDIVFQALGDHLDWLSSVSNDCVRMTKLLWEDNSELYAIIGNLSLDGRQNMGVLRESCTDDLSRTSKLSLEFLSCIAFKSFEGIVPTSNIFDTWSLKEDTVEKFVGECMWYLNSRFEHLEKSCHLHLIEIYLKKVIAWYLFFLKECADNSKISFSEEHYKRVQEDVKTIVESFSEMNEGILYNGEGENRITHELLCFQRIFVLLTEPIGSVEYTVAICNILDDVKRFPEEGHAMSSCLKCIFALIKRNKDYEASSINEYGVHPENYIRTMTSEMTAAADTVPDQNDQHWFSLGAYKLVFEAYVQPSDYFVHSATYVMRKRSSDSSNEESLNKATSRRSSMMHFKKLFHL